MKNLSFFNKIIFLINNVFALLFMASFAIPFISPKTIPVFSVLSLAVPLILIGHIFFVLYWILIGFKKQFLLSALCILIAILFSQFPYKFSGKHVVVGNSFSVMNYNVRLFNRYNWIEDEEIPNKISAFINENKPDILIIQEFYKSKGLDFNYPYKYIKFIGDKNSGQAIYSNYKIVNKGSLNFDKSSNNAIFIDVIRNNDTIRVYNIHLESFGIKPDQEYLGEKDSERLLKRLSKSFVKQQDQAEKFLEHKNKCHYKIIIGGDFNNTSFSWVYSKIKDGFKDSYIEAGEGFGRTYDFNKYPLRIDFILLDTKFNVNQHSNYDVKYSDHFPIMAKISL